MNVVRTVVLAAFYGAAGSAQPQQYSATILGTGGYFGGYGSAIHGGVAAGRLNGQFPAGTRAAVWNPGAAVEDWTPPEFTEALIQGASSTSFVGRAAGSTTGGWSHALVWDRATRNYADLHPSNFENSFAYGTDGGQQVGVVLEPGGGRSRPALWSGSAQSFIDLTPPGFSGGSASSVLNGVQGGGAGGPVTNENGHAMLWFGSPTAYADLHSAPYVYTGITGMSASDQVGYGSLDGLRQRALRWTGTASSLVDLHPSVATRSWAYGTNGNRQVGTARFVNPQTGYANDHAAMWSGTAASFVDLQSLLPSDFVSSEARGIDEFGNIVGVAYTQTTKYAVVWSPVPEASAGLGMLFGLAWLSVRQLKRTKSPRRD